MGDAAGRDDAPGLREQVGRVRDAGRRLATAHIALARAELSEIAGEIAKLAAAGALALGCLVLLALLVLIGGLLFLGETLFGSIGWALVHGPLLLIAIPLTVTAGVLGLGARRIARDVVVAILVGIVFGIVFGLDLAHRGWIELGTALLPGVEAGVRPLVTAVGVSAAVVGILGLLFGIRGGAGSAIAGLIGGAFLGAVLGALTAPDYGGRVGAAIGVKAWLVAWLAILGYDLATSGIDGETLKARFWPQQTILTAKETLEWAKEQTPRGAKS